MIIINRNRNIGEEIQALFDDGYSRAEIVARGYKAGTVHWALKHRTRPVIPTPKPEPEKPFRPVLRVSIETGGIRVDRRKEVVPWLA